MSTDENKAAIRRWIEEAWNKGNMDIADEIYASDFTATDIDDAAKILRGPDAIKQSVAATRVALPDIHFTIDHLIAEGDLVVGAFTIRGTHKGDLGGIPPTGKEVVFSAVDIWRFDGGKIVERCLASVDRLGLMQQLGVIPPPGAEGE
ncbi:MAG: ester cyclase [Candidatus Zixiibacteriota bacterium]